MGLCAGWLISVAQNQEHRLNDLPTAQPGQRLPGHEQPLVGVVVEDVIGSRLVFSAQGQGTASATA